MRVFGARVVEMLAKDDFQSAAVAGGAERRLRDGTLDRPDDGHHLVKQHEAERIAAREDGKHSNGVEPLQNNYGNDVDQLRSPSSRLSLPNFIGSRAWTTTEIQSEQFHADQQRVQTFLYRHLAAGFDVVVACDALSLLLVDFDEETSGHLPSLTFHVQDSVRRKNLRTDRGHLRREQTLNPADEIS